MKAREGRELFYRMHAPTPRPADGGDGRALVVDLQRRFLQSASAGGAP